MRNKRTPEVRFPGFSGGWEERKLGDLVIDVSRPLKMVDDDIYQLVTVKRRNGGIVSRGIYKGSGVLVKSQFIIKTGDYLISKRQVVHGANGIVPEYLDGSIVSNEYLVLHGTKDLNIKFFSLISELPDMYKNYFLSSYGVDIEKLVFNVADWKKRKISIPTIPEQNQITSFINTMNNVIALQQQELTILKQTKQGFLQKMFPKEGETFPEVRFPGYTGDWEERKFSDFTKLSQGLQIAIDKRYTEPGNNKLFYITNEFLKQNSDKKYFIEAPPKNVIAKKDDILMTRTGNTGKVVTDVEGAFHNNFFKIAYVEKETSKLFLFYLLNSFSVQKEIIVRAGTSTIPDLNHNDFYQIKVNLPSKNEQIKIGDFFKKIDDTIALHQRELDALKETKKAFLQKMFV
ncbi:restriction endonuclease subunit S [Bacillus nitratireducens]|uniref:restriction endonuclease subunit S n=1 Tax=Bacillus nitratireducens TaxID=2026193 RepID=UPI003390A7A7